MKRHIFTYDHKHKHMLKSGAPPDKFGVLYSLVLREFHFLRVRSSFRIISFGYWYYCYNFKDRIGPFNMRRTVYFRLTHLFGILVASKLYFKFRTNPTKLISPLNEVLFIVDKSVNSRPIHVSIMA